MAKGLEDTLMYTYNRFIAHNDVGDSPANFGISREEFHQAMIERHKKWPLSLNATSTHDTKRGEDARARLNVISDLADEWMQKVNEWFSINCSIKQNEIPDANKEYFIYQTLVATYPISGVVDDDYLSRLLSYIKKFLRETKTDSSWAKPNAEYEETCKNFVQQILKTGSAFINSFLSFQKKIERYGVYNSLTQLILKFTCPGVPDVYQGCECWDFSLVDPDNLRPVDYSLRQKALEELKEISHQENFIQKLFDDYPSAKLKLWLTQKLMELR
ncbi:MAG: hypothetical protein C4308_10685 [Chitinophagaceae bacterium]